MLRNLTENQKRWTAIVLATALGIAILAYKLYTSFVPSMAEYVAKEIPQEIYKQIGESSLKSFDQDEFAPSKLSQETQNKIRERYLALLETLSLPSENYQLHFRDWKGKMNAFALMDGSIVLTDELVLKLTSPQTIEAVILHEIGHIEHNHLMENTIRVSMFYIILSFVFGDISVVSDLLIESSVMGVSFSYSREFEEEADNYASQNLTLVYGDSSALVEALEKLHQDSEGDDHEESWLSTHPSLEQRKANLAN